MADSPPTSPAASERHAEDLPLSVLIIEDHDAFREVLIDYMNTLGWSVKGMSNGEGLEECLAESRFDAVVLDLNLPGEDGLSLCRRLRHVLPDIGIVMLTARTAEPDRVAGYENGADVYLGKPASNAELAAAVRRLSRRLRHADKTWGLTLEAQSLRLSGPVGVALLTEPESKVLRALATAPDRFLDYWQLLHLLELSMDELGKNALEVRIARLRHKLATVGASRPSIQSIRQKGYKLLDQAQIC